MSKILSVVFISLLLGLAAIAPVLAEVVDQTTTIGVSVSITGVTSLTVETRNRSDDALVTPSALNFSTGGIALPPTGNPWVVSNQYVRVVYSSNYGTWGIRIVTDNEDLEADANNTINSIAGSATAAGTDGVWGTADDVMSYSGLLSLTEIAKPLASQDPSKRAPWGWQVFAATQTVVTSPTSSINAAGALVDASSIGAWNANWAYLADKNDTGYNSAILEDGDLDGQVDDATYPMVVVGGGSGGGSLAQHPTATPKLGDGDIAVYISARFANTNWGNPATPIAYLLGSGSYSASLYVELIHE